MAKLLIVESPAKAKTISKYLGAGYQVKASMGHLRDLPKQELGVDVEHDFEVNYIPIVGKDKIINDLKDAADQAEFVFLATDPDREGEAISWHLKELLELPEASTKRITFNEITKHAVTEAVAHPRDLDMNLVDAQQARRILDRIVGYKLSPFLWRKVRSGLSAGRVQSAVTRLVVDREREIRAFQPEEYWSVSVKLENHDKQFQANLTGTAQDKIELHNQQETQVVLDAIEGQSYTVDQVKKSRKKRQPAPPFTTSTLQQEASRKLGMSAKRTMAVAQELYEGIELKEQGLTGLITYMRTDSLRISDEAQAAARSHIAARFGSEFAPAKARVFNTKKNAQDAHEAIRPSDPALEPEQVRSSLTPDQFRLYRLIWSRFMASQMADAVLDTTAADIACAGYLFRATGQTVAFPGFLAVYEESRDDENDNQDGSPLPLLEEGDLLKHLATEPRQHFTQPPARYTEASLIKAMEEKGIGRPSTYAPTISVIQDREYVVKENRALRPTNLGEAVTDLMIDKFQDIIDVQFTASMEERLDRVETGEENYRAMLGKFYDNFDAELKQAEIDLDKKRIKVKDEETDIVCELCGRNMVVKVGRFGKFLACPAYPECKNTKPIAQDTGVACPKCGSKLLKKKSKSGYYYYGCEKNPTCDFMTWDSPTKKTCPECGGVVFRHYTKEDKRNLCHMPNCGWSEEIVTRTRRKAAEGENGEAVETAPKKRGRKPKAETEAAAAETAPKKRGRKPKAETEAAAVETAPKKRGRKPKAETEAAAVETAPKKRGRKPKAETEAAAAPKKSTRKKKTEGEA